MISSMKPDLLILAFLSCFFLGRETSNVDMAVLLRSLNETKDLASKAFMSTFAKGSASDLINSVRKQVIEDHDVAGDHAEVGVLDLSSLEILGQGSFGTVYKGSWRGTAVAIKSMLLEQGASTKRQELLAIMEAIVSSALSHPNIAQTYAYSIFIQGTPERP
jgi:serine/threonine protein kinase